MKPDRPASRRDVAERAHLNDPHDRSHTIYRYPAPPDLAPLVQHFWIPVWSVPPGQEAPQQVLQYPCALIVITQDYARFYGVTSGLATTTLVGDGWAVGVLCQPAAGLLIGGASMAEHTDRFVDLGEVLGPTATALTDGVRAAMAGDPPGSGPAAERSHRAAIELAGDALRGHLPLDDEGLLINDLVAFVEQHPDVTKVAQLCERFELTERSLQRIVHRRIGLTPKWLIQRRRLHEASLRLRRRGSGSSLAGVAADLGYADQSHFNRDFRTATGMTPGQFADRYG